MYVDFKEYCQANWANQTGRFKVTAEVQKTEINKDMQD